MRIGKSVHMRAVRVCVGLVSVCLIVVRCDKVWVSLAGRSIADVMVMTSQLVPNSALKAQGE